MNGKTKQIQLAGSKSDDEDEEDKVTETKKSKTKIDKLFAQKNLTVLSEHYKKLKAEDESSDEDILQLKRADHDVSDDDVPILDRKKPISKTKRALFTNGLGQKLIFDENGNSKLQYEMESLEQFEKQDLNLVKEKFMDETVTKMKEADILDKKEEKERRRNLKRERKLKEKELRRLEVHNNLILVWPRISSHY